MPIGVYVHDRVLLFQSECDGDDSMAIDVDTQRLLNQTCGSGSVDIKSMPCLGERMHLLAAGFMLASLAMEVLEEVAHGDASPSPSRIF